MNDRPSRNFGLDLVRATEAAALAAGRWMGLGQPEEADFKATEAMRAALNTIDMEGFIAMGPEHRPHMCDFLEPAQPVGTGDGPQLDIVIDPIDGPDLVALGHPGAISVMAGAPRGAFWSPAPAVYLEKIVVDVDVADVLVPECMDAPAAWTLALVARAKRKPVSDLTVFLLDRPRHVDLIDEIRTAGAHVMLRNEGEVVGTLLAGMPDGGVDILMGVGGISEGLIAACAIKAMDGAMLGRLAPQSDEERAAVRAVGLDTRQVLVTDELVSGNAVFFAATGITDGPLLAGVQYDGECARSNSLIMRGETRTRRTILAEHFS
jgi:fructose-1,6-bisphosphatase II